MSEHDIDYYIHTELSSDEAKVATEFVEYLKNADCVFNKDNEYWRDKIYYILK